LLLMCLCVFIKYIHGMTLRRITEIIRHGFSIGWSEYSTI